MSEVFPRNILLRCGGRTLLRHGVLAVAGARRGLVEVPITFTRADATTCATYIDRDGIVRLAAAGVPRIEWWDLDGDGIKEPYYLHEGSIRSNAWQFTEDLTNAIWAKTNGTISANADGTADGIITNVGTLNCNVGQPTGALTDNTQQSTFFEVKAGNKSWARITTTDKSNTTRSSFVNVSTGALGTINAGHTVKVVQVGSYYRFQVMWPSATGATAPIAYICPADADNTTNTTGDGATINIYVRNAQMEVDKAFPSSYIPRLGAGAVTRAADALTIAPNFGQLAMSIFARFGERGSAISNSTAGPAQFGSGSTPFSRFDTFGTAYRFSNQQVAGAVASAAAAAPAIGQETKLLGVIFPDGSVKTYQSIAGGADTGGGQSGVQALVGGVWSTQLLTVGAGGWHGLLGDLMVLRDAHVMAEVAAVP